MSFEAGSIVGMLGLDNRGFVGGMLEAQGMAKLFPAVITDFLVNPLLGFAELSKEAFEVVGWGFEKALDAAKEYGNALREVAMSEAEAGEAARTLGLSVEAYTGLSAAAKLAGGDAMAFGEGMKFLNRNIADAATTNVDLRKEFYQLGISITDASGHLRSTEDVLYDFADAMKNLPDAQLRMKYAMDFMGKGAESAIPFLSKGSAGIRELIQEVQRFGAITSTTSAEAGDKYRHIAFDWDLMWEGIKKRATDPAIELIAKNFDKIQSAMFRLSDAGARGINAAFGYIESHHAQIEQGLTAIGDAAKKAFNYMVSEGPAATAALTKLWDVGKGWKADVVKDWPTISNELKEIKLDADALAPSLVTVATMGLHAFEGLRNAIISAEDAMSGFVVKQANMSANSQLPGAAPPDTSFTGSISQWENFIVPKLNQWSPSLFPLPPGYEHAAPPTYRGGGDSSQAPTYNVHVTNQVDPQKTAAEIVKQMLPGMAKAIDDLHKKNASAGRIAAQAKGL